MPSLVITGHPCVGKTTFVRLLSERALCHRSKLVTSVVVISEASACPDRTKAECYHDSRAEKFTRGALKAEFDKHCTSNDGGDRVSRLVILDSLNYIKGFRYELHCIAKAAEQRHGVVWVMCESDVARGWNRKRRKEREDGGDDPDCFYNDDMMDELMLRYEPPDQRNRWDKPLYRVDVGSTLERRPKIAAEGGDDSTGRAAEDALKRSVYNMHSLSESIASPSQSVTKSSSTSAFRKKSSSAFRRRGAAPVKVKTAASAQMQISKPPTDVSGENLDVPELQKMEEIIDAILDSFFLDVAPLKQGMSTATPFTADANVMHEVDSITSRVSTAFLAAQKTVLTVGSGKISVSLGGGKSRTIELTRIMQVAEVKRTRRQYVKWVTNHPSEDTSELGIATSFLSYMEGQF